VKAVASDAFRGYVGHYQADQKLERSRCDAVYPDWAFRSCVSPDVADEVLVAELDGSIVGFAALRINSPDEGEGLLYGVSSRARRHGMYRSLMVQSMNWCLRKGAACMVISTQITNIVAQSVWVRLGFEPSHSLYTLHKWFDEPGQDA
jgi:GNAT superfamily N-acetyltransferase